MKRVCEKLIYNLPLRDLNRLSKDLVPLFSKGLNVRGSRMRIQVRFTFPVFIKHEECGIGLRLVQIVVHAAGLRTSRSQQAFQKLPNARFLATVGRVKPAYRERFAAALLADDLVRVHTVDRDENPLYWKLLHAAGTATGLPVLYNTSFNLFGEPLVCTPRDAVRSFYSSGIDAMFVGQFFLQK